MALVAAIRASNYSKTACAYVDIDVAMFNRWMDEGAEALRRVVEGGTVMPRFYSANEGQADPIEKFWIENDRRIRRLWKKDRDLVYACFYACIKKAEGDRQLGLVTTIKKASVKSWNAAAWLLERMEPDDFAKAERSGMGGIDPSQPLSMTLSIRGGLAPEDVGPDEPVTLGGGEKAAD